VWGEEYATAIQAAKVCLGLLSKGNRDLHTRRSVEVPALGGLLCAERTSEHLDLFREDVEAVFWSDATECAEKCAALLSDPAYASSIAAAGQRRVQSLGLSNEALIRDVLQRAGATHAPTPVRSGMPRTSE
jgi:hypothetical protein